MDNLILAMGAEHVKPHLLKQIVSLINNERLTAFGSPSEMEDYIVENYEPKFDSFQCNVFDYVTYVVEEKYDGYSYLNCEGKFFSKRLSAAKGKEGTPIEKSGHLPHITNVLSEVYGMTGCDLHGEVYIPNGISDDITKILGCNEDEAVRRIYSDFDRRPRYMLIDIRAYKGKSLLKEPYYIRRALLEHLYYHYIRPLDVDNNIYLTEILHGDPNEQFKRIVNRGGEGIIIKKTNALYVPGKKPAGTWIKGKKKITLDVVITGFNDGTGKNKSLFGSFEFGLYINGKLKKCGNCSSGLSDSIRQMVASDPDSYIGHVMEIEAIQESVSSFRNAVFLRLRDDKDKTECTPSSIRVKDCLI